MEDLLDNSSMEGLVSFLNYRPEPIVGEVRQDSTVDETSTVDLSATVDESVEVVPPSFQTVVEKDDNKQHNTVDETSTDDVTATVDNYFHQSSISHFVSLPDVTAFGAGEKSTQRAPSTVDEISTDDNNFSESYAPRLYVSAPKGIIKQALTVDEISTVDSTKFPLLAAKRKPKELAATWISLTSGQTYEARKVQVVRLAQDGMTSGQERFYEAVWKAKSNQRFQVETINKHQKRFRAGYDILARVTRLADRNVQKNIPQLIAKKILHSYGDFDSSTRQGTTYDIFSYDQILDRQEAAGLCYIVKNGPGVEFVVPQGWTVDETSTDDVIVTVDIKSSVDERSSVDRVSSGSVDKSSKKTVDATSTPLDNQGKTLYRHSTSYDDKIPKDLWQGFHKLDPNMDEGAMCRLWQRGRELIHDLRTEELLHFFEARARLIYSMRGVNNPLGLLIKGMNDWLTPRKVEAHRQQQQLEAEEIQRLQRELGEL